MAEIEIPDPHEVKEKAEDPFAKRVALFVAIYAVALALAAAGGNNAGKDMMMAQMKATNLWAYYQAKVGRENQYAVEAEKLEVELAVRGATLSADERGRIEKIRDKYKEKAGKYAEEKGDIKTKAEKEEQDRDEANKRDPYFDFGEMALQIAVVLASVAMLSGKRWAFYASLVLALIGGALTLNGYMMFDGGKLLGGGH
jgi:Domain of unknown function (DUF4337)